MTITLASIANTDTFLVWLQRTNSLIDALTNNIVTANSAANGSASIGNTFIQGIFGATTIAATTLRGGNVQSTNTLSIGSNVAAANSSMYINWGNVSVNTTSIVVGANVTVNTSSIKVGNSSVFSFMNSSVLSVNTISNSVTIEDTLTVGNAAVITNSLNVGANVNINTTSLALSGHYRAAVNITTGGLANVVVDSFALNTFRTAEYFLAITDVNANNRSVSKMFLTQDGTAAYITEYGLFISNNSLGTFVATTNATHAILRFTPAVTNTTIKGLKSVLTL